MHTSWDTRQVSKWDLPNKCHFSMPKKHHGFLQHVQKSAENVGWISRKLGMSGMDLGINVTWPPPMGNLIQRICNMCITLYTHIYTMISNIHIYKYYTYYIYIYISSQAPAHVFLADLAGSNMTSTERTSPVWQVCKSGMGPRSWVGWLEQQVNGSHNRT